jgi:hypothetical protein
MMGSTVLSAVALFQLVLMIFFGSEGPVRLPRDAFVRERVGFVAITALLLSLLFMALPG